MALNFMDLLGSIVQGTMSSPVQSSRMSNAGNGIQDLLGSLLGAGQSVKNKVGGDNLAAGGIGALLGALMGGSRSTTANTLGGGMMGLLGMMAYKALKNSMGGASGAVSPSSPSQPQQYVQPTPQQQNIDAEIILTAMIDAAKADGQVDSDELGRIMNTMKSSGIGQDGMNYVIQKLQGPMETAKIVSAVKGRPDLAAQVYSASLMAIKVDTEAERRYLDKLAKAMGLSPAVVNNIEQLTGSTEEDLQC